jgi:hypothetical protein
MSKFRNMNSDSSEVCVVSCAKVGVGHTNLSPKSAVDHASHTAAQPRKESILRRIGITHHLHRERCVPREQMPLEYYVTVVHGVQQSGTTVQQSGTVLQSTMFVKPHCHPKRHSCK